jgi:hypothetical protein
MNDVEWVELESVRKTTEPQEFQRLLDQGSPEPRRQASTTVTPTFPVVGVFRGFSQNEAPLVVLPSVVPNEILVAKATLSLRRDQIGAEVVVLCEEGDPRRPIIIGLLEDRRGIPSPSEAPGTTVIADDERYVISAEREIVLRCGDASITLTRAGKVIIKGNYILSRSTGYNKIKGAAVDIN